MLIQPARAYTIVWTPSRSCHVVGRMRSACVCGGSAATNEVLHGPRLRTRSLVVTSLTSFLLYAVNKLGRARPTEPTTARTLHNNSKPAIRKKIGMRAKDCEVAHRRMPTIPFLVFAFCSAKTRRLESPSINHGIHCNASGKE